MRAWGFRELKVVKGGSSNVWVNMVLWEISVFHSFTKDCVLVGCGTMLLAERFPMCRSSILPSS